MNKKRAVIYCRVSGKAQVRGGSLNSQERICGDFVEQKSYTLVRTFLEKGESAKTADRTELQNLCKFCLDRKNQIDVVVFYKIDRWARLHIDYSNLRERLKKNGIIIQSATEHFDDNPAGRFLENVLASQAQFDNDVRAERCKNGMIDAVREGRFIWYAPVGYINVRKNGKSNLEHSEKAPLVKMAFEEVAKNAAPVEEIRRKMIKLGLGNDSRTDARSNFYRMLQNRIYIGWIDAFGESNRGNFLPIVDEPLFYNVQQVLRKAPFKAVVHQKEQPDFPLRRFVTRPDGATLGGCFVDGQRRRKPYYRFRKPLQSFRKKLIEESFIQLLDSLRYCSSKIESLKTEVFEKLNKANKEAARDRQIVLGKISQLKEKQSLVIDKNFQGVISDELLQLQLDRIQLELDQLSADIPEVVGNSVDTAKLSLFIEEFLKSPSKIWTKAPFQEKVKLQWLIFPRGLIYENGKWLTLEISNIFKYNFSISSDKLQVVYHPDLMANCDPKKRLKRGTRFENEARFRLVTYLSKAQVKESCKAYELPSEFRELARVIEGDRPENYG